MALARSSSERNKSVLLLEDYFLGLKGGAERKMYAEKLSLIGGLHFASHSLLACLVVLSSSARGP